MAGNIFQLGNTSWRILKIEPGKVRVEDARGAPPTIPFWLGEAPARTEELSRAVSDLRGEVSQRLAATRRGGAAGSAVASVDRAGSPRSPASAKPPRARRSSTSPPPSARSA